MSNSMGPRIQEALELRGKSQSELAEALGVTPGAVSQWVGGGKRPSRDNVRAAAAWLGVDATWLDAGEGEKPRPSAVDEREKYSQETTWRFRPSYPDGGRDHGNANIWTFNPTLDTLVREALQNVIDARASDGQVEARLRIIRLSGTTNLSDLQRFLEALRWADLHEHLNAAKDSPQKLGSLLRYALNHMDLDRPEQTELLLLRIEDRSTVGLLGPETGDGNFAALTRDNLNSSKSSSTSAGAFGLGKGVFWRASLLATVLFNSNLSEPEDGHSLGRIIGRTELPWHHVEGQECAGPGWFGSHVDQPEDRVGSVWENSTLARDLFLDRDETCTGTSILVVGFADPSEERSGDPRELAEEMGISAAANFWPAMACGDLRVVVETADAHTVVSSVVVDPAENRESKYYVDAFVRHRDGEGGDSLAAAGDVAAVPVELEVPRRLAEPDRHDTLKQECVLVVRRCDDSPEDLKPQGQLALFRGSGMVVRYHDLNNLRLGALPFRAALLCGTAVDPGPEAVAAERFLRTAEPPAHNEWALTQELKADYAWGGGAALKRLVDVAKATIADLVAPDYDSLSDGPRDLKALFRIASPTESDQRPRFKLTEHALQGGDRWRIKGRVTTDGKRSWRVRPVLVFAGESGPGMRSRWMTLEIEQGFQPGPDGTIIVPKGSRSVEFIAVSDPASHPVDVSAAAVMVELRDLVPLGGE